MPTGLDYDRGLSVLESTRNDEGPVFSVFRIRVPHVPVGAPVKTCGSVEHKSVPKSDT